MPEIKVAIANDFLTAFAKLPRQIQSKVTDFIVKFKNNPTAPGINYEKLKYCIDDKLCSVRIDEAYRGIVVRQEQTGVYLLLWVDHHDEAYDWAKRKKCDVNPNTGSIQIYDILSVEQKQDSTESIFKTIPDSKLALLGVPSEQKKMLDSITSKEMFFSMQSSFSRDVFENL
jgi:mRNA-degrading endonuclease RelE of RelBE toxin-antitoxin system